MREDAQVPVQLKRVNLMLHEDLHEWLKLEAHKQNVSMSHLVRRLLRKGLGIKETPVDAVSRIRRMREVVGPLPDSSAAVRKWRDRL
jgi:hypothetical protein